MDEFKSFVNTPELVEPVVEVVTTQVFQETVGYLEGLSAGLQGGEALGGSVVFSPSYSVVPFVVAVPKVT